MQKGEDATETVNTGNSSFAEKQLVATVTVWLMMMNQLQAGKNAA